jgi:hypothetical protein
MTTHRVPLADLGQQQRQIKHTPRECLNRVLAESGVFGPQVEVRDTWARHCGLQLRSALEK